MINYKQADMEKEANTRTLSVEIFSNCKKIWIVEYTDKNYHNWQKLFDKIMQFFRELKSFGKVHPLWFQECFQCVSKVLQECPIRDSRVFCASISHKELWMSKSTWITMLLALVNIHGSDGNVEKSRTFAESIIRLVSAARKARIISRSVDLEISNRLNEPTSLSSW